MVGGAELATNFDDIDSGPFDSGNRVILSKRETTLLDLTVTWSKACWNDFFPLMDFYDSVRGRLTIFTFVVPFGAGYSVWERLGWSNRFIAVADGVEDTYELPLLEYDMFGTSPLSIYSDRVLVASTDYTLEASGLGTGEEGRIKIVYDTPPSAGTLLTVSGKFAAAIYARFGAPGLRWTPSYGYVINIQAQIREERP